MKRLRVSGICACGLMALACLPLPRGAYGACDCCLADINQDCSIDHDDLRAVTEQWLAVTFWNITDGLVGYWSFDDGTAVDDTANGNDGTIYGAMPAAGVSGQALSFDGVDDRVVFNNVIGNFGTGDFSIAFWMLTDASRLEGVMGKRTVCAYSSFFDFRIYSTGSILIVLNQDATVQNRISLISTSNLGDHRWHHLVIVRQGNLVSLYVDGHLDQQSSAEGTTHIVNNADFIMGRSACTGLDGTSHFTGCLDEIRIYHRALCEQEVRYLYYVADGEGQLPADLNGDDVVNLKDFAVLSSCWLGQNPDCYTEATYPAPDTAPSLFDYMIRYR